jgi:hypothetical protein
MKPESDRPCVFPRHWAGCVLTGTPHPFLRSRAAGGAGLDETKLSAHRLLLCHALPLRRIWGILFWKGNVMLMKTGPRLEGAMP